MSMELEKEQEQKIVGDFGQELELEDPEVPEVPEFQGADDDLEVPEEDDQMALFDLPEEKKQSKKAEKKEPVKKEKAAPETKVNSDFVVFYAGHKVNVPEDGMTIEQVRAFLESDFPELSKERTEMTIDKEKKEIVPVVKGAKKG
jgi:hypothetical protein